MDDWLDEWLGVSLVGWLVISLEEVTKWKGKVIIFCGLYITKTSDIL